MVSVRQEASIKESSSQVPLYLQITAANLNLIFLQAYKKTFYLKLEQKIMLCSFLVFIS